MVAIIIGERRQCVRLGLGLGLSKLIAMWWIMVGCGCHCALCREGPGEWLDRIDSPDPSRDQVASEL